MIAHRGDPTNVLENSLASVRSALACQVDMIEIDIRRSRDGELYVLHDRTTQRTAARNIDIEEATAEDIAATRLKNGEPIPTLSDVLMTVGGAAGLNLEVKSSGTGTLVAQHLASSHYAGQVLVSSFKEDEIVAVHNLLPALPVSLIFDFFTVRDVAPYRGKGYGVISLRKNTATERLIAACHDQGVRVYVWTVDEEPEMRKFISWGVDGIYSNKPALLKTVVEGSKR